MRKLLLSTGFLLLTTGLAAAQGTAPKINTPTTPTTTTAKMPKTAKPPKTPKTPKVVPTDDAGIKTCIEGELAKSKMAGEGFAATVNGGAATFTGATKVPGHKGGVSGIGKSCGAKSIVNNITIEGKPAAAPKTPKTPKVKTSMTNPSKTN